MLRRAFFTLSVLSLSIASAHATETYSLDTPRLAGIDNFRDVAGTSTAYTTASNGVLRSGVFYRSNALTPTADDLAVLNGLGISDVYDLRTSSEIASTPDTLPEGASWHSIDIIGDSGAVSYSLHSAADAIAMMEGANRSFASDAGMRERFALLFEELAAADGAALFHCTAGKDRTGWTAAVLLSIAGVDSETIMADYLATNDYTAERIAATLAAMPASMAEIYAPLFGVQASFLQAGLDEVIAQYGSMDGYLSEGLGLSQETIYALRGKLVRYAILPGATGLQGNAAAGAQLLTQLQDSSLGGTSSAYNYYLQSAIDAGSLGGLESSIGGQLHADAASYLLRQDALIERATAPHAAGIELQPGQRQVWMTALAGYQGNDGSARAASSNEHTGGSLFGITQRFSEQLSAHAGFGYSQGQVSAASGEAETDLTLLVAGVRFAPEGLQQGLFVDGALSAGWLDYSSKRQLGGGLGQARGDSDGTLASARAALGYRFPVSSVTLEPSFGLRVSHLDLDGFQEKGSELALHIDGQQQTRSSALLGLKAEFAARDLGAGWQLVPGLQAGYEHALSGARVDSDGQLLGLDISQRAAFDGRNQYSGAFSLTASSGALSVALDAGVNDGNNSHDASGTLKLGYQF